MDSLFSAFNTARDLLLVIAGFTLIIVVHELGHFMAARWAGVRVMAFAVGFGPALCSYRKGLGLRRGSTVAEFEKLRTLDPDGAVSVSPTEYRLNALPFGGYVKMLGQDDTSAGATSDEPDSFQSAPVWKRMVIISAGVVMNVVLAAVLFMIVFMVGLRAEPPIVGRVAPEFPAAAAVPVNGIAAGVTEPGLKPGDRIVSIDGEEPVKFQDLVLASAMAKGGRALELVVRREGVAEPLRFEIVPKLDDATRLQMLGVGPAVSNRLPEAKSARARDAFDQFKRALELPLLEPGMTLVSVDGRDVGSAHALARAAAESGGERMLAVFERAGGGTVEVELRPRPELMSTAFKLGAGVAPVDHVLGLMPVMRVANVEAGSGGAKAGLISGDVFSLLGSREWPSFVDGIEQIHAHKGRTIRVSVMRPQPDGTWKEIDLGQVPVTRQGQGQIGFTAGDSAEDAAWVAGWPRAPRENTDKPAPSGSMLGLVPGSRIVSIDGQDVATLHDAREALRRATRDAGEAGTEVELVVALPGGSAGAPRVERATWQIPASEVVALHALRWQSPIAEENFELDTTVLQASGPIEAIGIGLHETHSTMLTTYLTLARLFQGTVKVSHLKGPVGIAHTGTLLAGRGWDWLVFFMALISVNLAVINFLPIPIADGGHMVFLAYEQATGKPVSPVVQNVAALVGLALLASVFLVVTFNDLRNLFTG